MTRNTCQPDRLLGSTKITFGSQLSWLLMTKKLVLCKQRFLSLLMPNPQAPRLLLMTVQWEPLFASPSYNEGKTALEKNIPSNCTGFLQEENDTATRPDFYLVYLVLGLLKPAVAASSHV